MKIAIVRLSALGDIIQSAIVLQFIKKINKNIEIHWFVDKRFANLLQDHPLIDELYVLPLKDKNFKETFAILFEARQNKYDVVIDLQGLIKSAVVSRILGSNVFGFNKNGLRETFAHNFYSQKFDASYNENVYIRYLSLVHYAFNEEFDYKEIYHKQAVFPLDEEVKDELIQRIDFNQNLKNVLIHVGSAEDNKIYSITKMALLCKMLVNVFSEINIYLCWGNQKEYYLSQELIQLSQIINSSTQALIQLPKLSLKELICMTKISDLVIGNDSGPTHLAFALNKPSITIFGATWDSRVCIETQINKTISAGKKFDTNVKFKFDRSDFCIQNIDEKDIFKLACELLEK